MLLETCFSRTCITVQFGKHSSFLLKNGLAEGDTLSTLLFNFLLEYVIKKVRVNKRGLKDERYPLTSGLR